MEADDGLIPPRAFASETFWVGIFVRVGENFLDPFLVMPVDQLDPYQTARLAGMVVDGHPPPRRAGPSGVSIARLSNVAAIDYTEP